MKRTPKVNVAWMVLSLVMLTLSGDLDYSWGARAALGFIAFIFLLLFGASIQNAIDHQKDKP